MISPTTYYQEMLESIKLAKKLVSNIDEIECKTDLQHLKLQGYILIVHSIFEEYLENICGDAAKTAKRNYEESGALSSTLVALIATTVVDKISDTARKKVSKDLAKDMSLFAIDSVSRYVQSLNNNHGITSENQNNLLLPIGINIEIVDIGLSQNLNAFGRKRGAIAHSFVVKREETLSDVDVSIKTISRDLIQLDEEICKACTPLSP